VNYGDKVATTGVGDESALGDVGIRNAAGEACPIRRLLALPAVDKLRGIPVSLGTQRFTGPTTSTITFFILS
jgi:hypothetical protein